MAKWIAAVLAMPALCVAISLLLNGLEMRTQMKGASTALHGGEARQDDYKTVPLVRLLATPERYEGRKVRVEGFLSFEFEDTGLFPDKETWSASLRANSLMVDVPAWASPTFMKSVTRRYAGVSGTFFAGKGPEYGYGGGSLMNVQQIEPKAGRTDFYWWRLRENQRALNQHLVSGWFLTLVGWTILFIAWVMRRRP
jgi:hypothetical protein